ncbi:MAG: sugar phosphate nucleotidyltransferase [Acidobacteriota bacterium]|nr:sugar phosphate nucleotidyltransferase [Acidobacteriota bacterium]
MTRKIVPAEKLVAHAVILAGGRGTRFWPRSRTRTPKQLLNIIGDDSMLQQTVARLAPLVPVERIWTVTNSEQSAALSKHLPTKARRNILTEPAGRNTAAAIALAAIHIRHATNGDALMGVLPADLFIAQAEKYRKIARLALKVAREPGRMVVLGIPPTRPETGFGYIQRASTPISKSPFPVYPVHAFTEKPPLDLAKTYIATGNYQWNAGMFFWRVSTFLEYLKKYLPDTSAALESLADSIGTRHYAKKLGTVYKQLQSIAVDYAILEPATREKGTARVFVIPAEIGWSDIGSWTAVYEQIAKNSDQNALLGSVYAHDAEGNFIWSPQKFVGIVGVRDLVVVDTPDALLICPRSRSQEVGTIVKWLEQHRRHDLL